MSEWDWSRQELAQLHTFLADRALVSGPITTRRIGDGHSNLTYLVTDGNDTVVVRRPPPPPIPPGANDMLREARIMSALSTTDVPVPGVLATAAEGEVIDVPLYVMTFAAGPVVTTATPESLSAAATRHQIGLAMADTLAALHEVDWTAVGLADLGRPEGFNARHVSRMRRLIADADGNAPEEFADIDDWLLSHTPPESGATLVHCDFRIGNVVLEPDAPGRIAAVLDWELCTLGDPLLDVGYLAATIPEHPRNPVRRWCTVTSGSATWCSNPTLRAASRRSSTGNCVRSAIRSSTSDTLPRPFLNRAARPTRPQLWAPRCSKTGSPRAPRFWRATRNAAGAI